MEDSELFHGVIARLREIEPGEGLERTVAIGKLVLSEFFGGDPTVWRDQRRNKNHSIRRLASRAGCPMSRSALNDAIGIYVAVLESPCVLTFGHIRPNHVATVLKLPAKGREEMLRRAEEQRWSVRELRENVTGWITPRGHESTERPSRGQESTIRPLQRGHESTVPGSETLALIGSSLGSLSAAVRQLHELSPLDANLRPNIEKLGRDLLRIQSELLEIPTAESRLR